MAIILSKPQQRHQKEYENMIQEFLNAGDPIQPNAMKLEDNENYNTFLERLDQQEKGTYKPEIYVPSSLYFLVDEESEKILGAIHFRHTLNDVLKIYGGHIGYGVRPSERKKGYATLALKLIIPIVHNKGINEIRLDCKKENIGSAKIIQKNGGTCTEESIYEGEPILKRKIKDHYGK